MRELLTCWRDSRTIVYVAATAAAYAATALLVDGAALPGTAPVVDPASAWPPVASLLLGPAAAWGSALGALVADVLGGVIGTRTAVDVLANFASGLLGYRLWGRLGPLSSDRVPDMRSRIPHQLVEYWLVALVSAAASAAIVAWGVDLLGLAPFDRLAPPGVVSRALPAAVVGPVILRGLHPPLTAWGVGDSGARPRSGDRSDRASLAAYGISAVSIGWVLLGLAVTEPPGSPEQRVIGSVALLAIVVLLHRSGPDRPASAA